MQIFCFISERRVTHVCIELRYLVCFRVPFYFGCPLCTVIFSLYLPIERDARGKKNHIVLIISGAYVS